MKNKEIEITYIVKDRENLEKILIEAGAVLSQQRVLNREVYEDGGKFFIRYSTEIEGSQVERFFTMKNNRDLNSVNKIKKKLEIEFAIDDKQEEGLKSVFETLGYKKTNSYMKVRKAYALFNCNLSIDIMDNKTYFEVEFKDENDMKKIIKLIGAYLEQK